MKTERVLGLDYGDTNIGVAFGSEGLTMSLPPLPAKDLNFTLDKIARLTIEEKASKIVLGLPLNAEGKPTLQAIKVRTFANKLKLKVRVPIEFVDEHATTSEALKEALSRDISKKGREKLDSISAEMILKRYFSE